MYRSVFISDYYQNALGKIKSLILKESEAQIIGSETEQLAQFYIQEYSLSPIKLNPEREPSWTHVNYVKIIRAHEREHGYQDLGDLELSCEMIRVEIPIEANKDITTLAELISSNHSFSYSQKDFSWDRDLISFVVETKGYGFTLDENSIATAVNNGIKRVQEIIEWKNADLVRENANLLNQVKNLIEERKKVLQQNKQMIATLTQKITIPLKKQIPLSARKITLDQKPIVKRIKPSPRLPEEYVLEESKVNDILEVLDGHAKSFEKTPNALVSLGEEDLRDLILANLNSIFQGKATGETFSKKGKTDIYLNIDKGNILVFECKNWGGKKLFLETIDQLRGYLTWRHNYGVIIFFVKLKSFTKILSEIVGYIQESSSYVNSVRKVNETHFTANHRLDDDEKTVKIHYLFYNLHSE